MWTPFSWGVESPTKFSKKGASEDLNFERKVGGKETVTFLAGGGRDCNCYIKNKLKLDILNNKKTYKPKCLSVITKNLNWQF